MPSSASNDNGRALEYAVTRRLKSKGATLTPTAVRHQSEYQKYFDNLLPKLKSDFEEASGRIVTWIASQVPIESSLVDKSIDSDPGTADVLISGGSQNINLSLKHNHDALKHQRPHALAQQCGFSKNSAQDIQHRVNMKAVEEDYRNEVPDAVNYIDEEDAKFDMLEKVCDVSVNSINQWADSNPSSVKSLFGFLVANDCYQVIVSTKGSVKVEVHDYNGVNMPSSVVASVDTAENSEHRIYMQMNFDNGFELRARLHTASKKISAPGKQISLKFDTKKDVGTVPVTELPN